MNWWKMMFNRLRAALGIVQLNSVTGALEVNGVAVTGTIPVTMAQFLVLDQADYIGAELWIEDIPIAHSLYNGVAVRANAAGTGWIWMQTPSFTRTTVPTAAQASGWRIFVSDIGPRGSFWYSNGTRYNLDQDSVVLAPPILSPVVVTNSYLDHTVVRQVEIPTLDGKSVWGDGDMLEIHQIANKTGTIDILNNSIYLGKNIVAVDATETNTVITGANYTTAATNRGLCILQRLLRKNSTTVKLMSGNSQNGLSGVSTAVDVADTTVTTLDSGPWYLDATLRLDGPPGDSALTLTTHSITLISSGAA